MKRLIARNDFHGSSICLYPRNITEGAYGRLARITPADLARATHELCGIRECCCSGPSVATDGDGNVYHLTT